MGNWSVRHAEWTSNQPSVKPRAPATPEQIAGAEKRLGCAFPADLTELLLELNGDDGFLFSTEQIVETNLLVRSLGCFMPLDCLLFFAGNGCGDYYGYPITPEDGVRADQVFFWDHEYDSRIWMANGLAEVIQRYYNDEF